MRTLPIFALALALAGGTAADAAAQQQGPAARHEMRGDHGPAQRLLRGIELTDAQRQQVHAIMQEAMAEHRDGARRGEGRRGERTQLDSAARAQRRAEMQARRAQMEQRHAQLIAQVRQVLTPEQRTVFDRNVAEMEAHRAEHRARGEGRGEGRGRSRTN